MGEMMPLAPAADAGRFICVPHPVLLDGRTNVPCDLRPGETLYAFLSRHIDLTDQWEVRIGGEVVPVEMWLRVKPKHGQVIEVVHAVNRQALMIVAFIALTYFTMGAGATAGAAMFGAGTTAAAVANVAVYVAGSILINKVLGPKEPEPVSQTRDSVYSINSARNQARPYDPVGLLFGHSRITPDLASMPYIWHEGDDQYLGMVLNVGANVHDVGAIYHGDGLLSQFDGVQVYYNGIPGKPDQTIPLYSNADTIEGGELEKTTAWVQRTTPPETVRIQLNIEGVIGDRTNKGRDHDNRETIQAEYRPVGSSAWQVLTSRVINNYWGKNFETQRVTMSRDVPEGQYDVRVRRLYTAQDADKGDHNANAQSQFQWTTMVAVQSDDATYAGMGRIGIRIRATGQLSGALDQLRMEAWSRPVPVWDGSAWVTETTSNPGALILQFLRGIFDENGKIIAGLGLDEDEIDIPSLQAFMVHCAAEGYQYNHYLRDVRNNGDQLAAMARAGFGAMSWESGRWGVVWAADGQPVSGVVNMATIKKGQFQVDYTLAQAADGIEYTYLDSSDWQVKTLRVPAPGVEVMLNPASVQAEGVSTEAHAAQMARWHLAQSLYQYKDIVYSTDLEHLAYKRMDVLQLQHDLTQWGYGGRLVAVDGNVLTLDEPVPGNAVAWIGVRMPGEAVYRTLRVQAFEGESDTITLRDPWPSDAALPGEGNPAHDHIWIYDFKATPGYRVRVVGKELESDAKGASVAVVPEGPEFWTYVKTGEYIPPQPGSLLDTRPKASNVAVSEVQVVTGDVIHTELSVTFDLKGPAARTVIFAGLQGSEIGPVAETVTQTARFRIGSAGTYTIVVRPYNADGIAGESATVTYTTEGADIPPPPFDWVSVTVEPAGLRRYAWGYHQFQPADLAGAEIRFMPGTVADPVWDDMTPLGADGFFTAAFESDVPVAGEWTFAFAAINTAGDLSAPVVTHVTLTENVGEHLEDHEERITDTQQIVDEMLSDFADMDQRVADARAEAQAAAAALNERADDLRDDIDAEIGRATDAEAALGVRADQLRADIDSTMAQLNDILGAEEHDPALAYDADSLVVDNGHLYRAVQDVPAGTPITDAAYWALLGDYASLGDAVAAALAQLAVLADELLAQAESLNLLGAANGAGTAWLLNMQTVRVSATETMAQWRASIQSAFGDANARIDAEETARADADTAQVNRLVTMEARMPTGTGPLATSASVTAESTARATADTALASRATALESRMPSGTGQLATAASVSNEATTRATADAAMASDIGLMGARNAQGTAFILNADTTRVSPTETLAQWRNGIQASFQGVNSRIDSEAATAATASAANASRLDAMEVALGAGMNLVKTPVFRGGGNEIGGWTSTSPYIAQIIAAAGWGHFSESRVLRIEYVNSEGRTVSNVEAGATFPVTPGEVLDISVDSRTNVFGSNGYYAFGIVYLDVNGAQIGSSRDPDKGTGQITSSGIWGTYVGSSLVPDNAVTGVAAVSAVNANSGGSVIVTRMQIRRRDATALASARANESTQLQVTQQAGAISAVADQVSTLEVESGQHAAGITEVRRVTLATLDSQPIVNDPGFERGEWGGNPDGTGALPNAVRFDTQAVNQRSGVQSLRFGASGTDARRVFNTLAFGVEADRTYRISAWVIRGNAVSDGSGVAIGFRRHMVGGTVAHQIAVRVSTDEFPDNVFQKVTGTYTTRTTDLELRPYIEGTSNPNTQRWAVDDVSVELVSETEEDLEAVQTAQGQIITAMQGEVADKAAFSYVQSVEGTATAAAAQASANLTAINGMSATVAGHTASINEVREVAVAATDSLPIVNDPGFERGEWGTNTDGTGGRPHNVTFNNASVNQRTGNQSLRFGSSSSESIRTMYNRLAFDVIGGRTYRYTAYVLHDNPNSIANIQIGFRRGHSDGNVSDVTVANRSNWSTGRMSFVKLTGTYTPTTAFRYLRPYVRVENHNGGGAIVVDDVSVELFGEDLASVLARYTLAVQAGGDVAGMQLLAGGGTSAIRFLADMFSVVNPSGTAGLNWENGDFWLKLASGHSFIVSSNLGEGMGVYYGPTPTSASSATRANALFYLAGGTGYFAGQVLQGVLRWFNSTTATGGTVNVTTGSNPRLGKTVSLSVRYTYSEHWVYSGSGANVTPGSGITQVTVTIERRYGAGAWTSLGSRQIHGAGHAYNGQTGSGDPSSWSVSMSGEVFATDTASTTNSEYRARISGRSIQGHSGSGTAAPVIRTQYLSIEAME